MPTSPDIDTRSTYCAASSRVSGTLFQAGSPSCNAIDTCLMTSTMESARPSPSTCSSLLPACSIARSVAGSRISPSTMTCTVSTPPNSDLIRSKSRRVTLLASKKLAKSVSTPSLPTPTPDQTTNAATATITAIGLRSTASPNRRITPDVFSDAAPFRARARAFCRPLLAMSTSTAGRKVREIKSAQAMPMAASMPKSRMRLIVLKMFEPNPATVVTPASTMATPTDSIALSGAAAPAAESPVPAVATLISS
ncbi:MAG: hypothetical protein BWY85_01306 [Firmicutes bacterium ADurb.Bin506]|nr:MAG: hypothetical protein BWY85_01306 [Firmicutes bacterium ADurb.Bin506]